MSDNFAENNDETTNGRERRLANLRPFPKGTSGNAGGRPKTAHLSNALRKQLAEVDGDGKTIAAKVADKLIKLALDGEVSAIREIFDRTEGRAKQSLDVDMSVSDWRTLADEHQLDRNAILTEAVKLLRDSRESSDAGDA